MALLVVDRHVEKNGGESMARSLQNSDCVYYGYGIWPATLNRLRRMLLSNKSTKACVEAHSPVPDGWLTLMRQLPVQKALILLRIRRPPQHYVSFYRWGVRPNVNFTDWFPGDLQSNILLHAHLGHVSAHHSQPWARGVKTLSASACERAWSVARSVDILMTTESLDSGWEELRRQTGLALPARRISQLPRFGRGEHMLPLASVVQQMSEELAPCDWIMYAMALQRTFTGRVFERRLLKGQPVGN